MEKQKLEKLKKQHNFKDLLIKLDKQYDNQIAYDFLSSFISNIFNKDNQVKILLTYNKKHNFLICFYSLIPKQYFILSIDFNGVLINHTFFIHLFNLINYESYEIFSEKQLKNFLFYLYESKEINKIIIQNQYFNDTRLKKYNKSLFLNFLNILTYKQYTTNEDLLKDVNQFLSKTFKETYKINDYVYENNFYNMMKIKQDFFFNNLNQSLKLHKDYYFFNFEYNKLDDKQLYLNYGIYQDIFKFDSLFDLLSEKIKKENLNRYEEFKNYKKRFKDLDQQEILQFFNFNDLKILVED